MRVLLLVPDPESLGGVSNYYSTLQLHKLCSGVEYLHVNCAKRESGTQVILRLARNYFRFWRKLATGNYDLVIVNPSFNQRSFYRDAIFCWIAAQHRHSFIVFFRGWSNRFETRVRNSRILRCIFRRTFARANDFIVLGKVFKEKLIELGCRPQSCFHIETTVADDRALSEGGTSNGEGRPCRVLYLSRLVRGKGARTAIDAFGMAQGGCESTMELIVAGDGPELPALRKYARELDNVHFCGEVLGAAKWNLMKSSHVLLFPSRDEGMPNVVLEAMLCGMPVITTTVGSIPEVVEHGVNGYIAEPGDASSLAQWLIRVVEDAQLRQQIGSRNREKAKQMYSRSKVRYRILKIINDTVRKYDT